MPSGFGWLPVGDHISDLENLALRKLLWTSVWSFSDKASRVQVQQSCFDIHLGSRALYGLHSVLVDRADRLWALRTTPKSHS